MESILFLTATVGRERAIAAGAVKIDDKNRDETNGDDFWNRFLVSTGSLSYLPKAEPSEVPTASPIARPNQPPTTYPTAFPIESPTVAPTGFPTESPTTTPSQHPTELAARFSTATPTRSPTESPTASSTKPPTEPPATAILTEPPAEFPTVAPTEPPTETPTVGLTNKPTFNPTSTPTKTPVATQTPTQTVEPTVCRTNIPCDDVVLLAPNDDCVDIGILGSSGEFQELVGTCTAGQHCHTLSDDSGKCVPPSDSPGVYNYISDDAEAGCTSDCDCIGRNVEEYSDNLFARYFCDGQGTISRASFEACDSCFVPGSNTCQYSGNVVRSTYTFPDGQSCPATAYTTYEGYDACRTALIELGCLDPRWYSVDYYNRCTFFCILP